MEDIQDGKKVSIQNGVTEDPGTDSAHKSYGAIPYISTEITNPEIESSVRGEIGRTAITATISSSVAGVVT